jgi:hypothetical protein
LIVQGKRVRYEPPIRLFFADDDPETRGDQGAVRLVGVDNLLAFS